MSKRENFLSKRGPPGKLLILSDYKIVIPKATSIIAGSASNKMKGTYRRSGYFKSAAGPVLTLSHSVCAIYTQEVLLRCNTSNKKLGDALPYAKYTLESRNKYFVQVLQYSTATTIGGLGGSTATLSRCQRKLRVCHHNTRVISAFYSTETPTDGTLMAVLTSHNKFQVEI